MKLSKLYCNQATFKNIRFNLKGLNVISADVKSSLNDKKNSHDLGKTKLAELIDFMLLKKIKSKKEHFFFKILDEAGDSIFHDYVFFLEIMLNSGEFLTIRRNVESNTKISFSLNEQRIPEFSESLNWTYEDVSFDKAKTILSDYLSIDIFKNKDYDYRTSISYSLRNQDDFGDVYKLSKVKGKDINWKPFMFDLLGFKGDLLKLKYQSDSKIADINKLIDSYKIDASVRVEDRDQIVAEKYNVESEFKEIESKIDKFNFYEQDKTLVRKGIDDLEANVSALNSISYRLNYEIDKLNKSIKNNFSFDMEKVKKVFEESKIFFPDQLVADYDSLIAFNKKLTIERNSALKETIKIKETELKDIDIQLKESNKEREDLLSYLTDSDTFAKFKFCQKELVKVEGKLSNYREKLKAIDNILTKEDEIETLQENIKTTVKSLAAIFKTTENNDKYMEIRTSFTKFYKKIMNEDAYISWRINTVDNVEFVSPKVRSKIDTNKDSAKDDGHTYKKMLCVAFDLSILTAYNNESYYRFVYHDDVLSQQDNGIKLRLLELIDGVLKEYDLQYMLSVIESDLPVGENGERFQFSDDDVVLSLHDKDESGTLFGLEF
jgi:uncharacterized protein YydD (DUF2326 family)